MKSYSLFFNSYCYFCQKVLTCLNGKEHKIELRSVAEQENLKELMKGGGKSQVPCLKIVEADQTAVQWMYESDDILQYIVSNDLVE